MFCDFLFFFFLFVKNNFWENFHRILGQKGKFPEISESNLSVQDLPIYMSFLFVSKLYSVLRARFSDEELLYFFCLTIIKGNSGSRVIVAYTDIDWRAYFWFWSKGKEIVWMDIVEEMKRILLFDWTNYYEYIRLHPH